jgi:uncharacterized protein (TIGR03382 family)
MLHRVALGLGLVACLAACGPTPTPGEPALSLLGQPIINGEPDSNPAHQAVVSLSLELAEGAAMCSGTLIAPRVVLTAAHCVADATRVDVRFGSSAYVGTQIAASEWLAHPNYDSRRLSNDIALVRLSEPPPEGVVPIPYLPSALALTDVDLGTELEFVGFGEDEAGIAGTKLTVRNQLDWLCDSDRACYFEWQGLQVWAAKYTLCHDMVPGGTCSGDSGGPAFLERDSQEYVVGVTSYGGDEDCTTYGCSTKVDRFQGFIEDFLGLPDGSPCDATSVCGSGFCSDGFCCDLVCGSRCQRCDLPGSEGRCTPIADGSDCSDGNACNGAETCQSGSCLAGTPLACADEVACTRDLCDPALGCVFRPAEQDCWDDNPCTQDTCDLTVGCTNPPVEDGTPCELGRVCRAARCVSESSGCASAGQGGLGPLAWLLALALALAQRRR